MSKPDADEIVTMLGHPQSLDETYQPFGDGHAAEKIVKVLEYYVL